MTPAADADSNPGDFAPIGDARGAGDTGGDGCVVTADALAELPLTRRMPTLFLGHGSPMNALADNAFTKSLARLAKNLPRPAAVLVVSAHWLTPGETRVLCTAEPRTIHDFWGFPEELYAVSYPAPGEPGLGKAVAEMTQATTDTEWGLDHASWTLLRHMYPDADVPVLELSLDVAAQTRAHLDLARLLAPLRDRGVLILGSGNLVHNLGAIDWDSPHGGYDWAIEFDRWATTRIEAGDVDALVDYQSLAPEPGRAVPTNEHYLPLLYAMALRDADEPITFPYEGMEMGSLSMRCVRVG
jgi:4,5-DOPA dioxygenase extradiol